MEARMQYIKRVEKSSWTTRTLGVVISGLLGISSVAVTNNQVGSKENFAGSSIVTQSRPTLSSAYEIRQEEALATTTTTAAPAPPTTQPAHSTSAKASRSKIRLNWPALAQCESSGNPKKVSKNGIFRGAYQFLISTWRSVGGKGDPAVAPLEEQTARAQMLYNKSGSGPWPECGHHLYDKEN